MQVRVYALSMPTSTAVLITVKEPIQELVTRELRQREIGDYFPREIVAYFPLISLLLSFSRIVKLFVVM